MAELTLETARKILDAALAKGVEKKLKPLVITILDARGCVKVTAAQDGTSLMRAEIAHGKAYGALAMGMGSRALFQRAQEQAYFVDAVNTLAQGRMVPVPGGVLIMDGSALLGAVGVSGDTSDNDESLRDRWDRSRRAEGECGVTLVHGANGRVETRAEAKAPPFSSSVSRYNQTTVPITRRVNSTIGQRAQYPADPLPFSSTAGRTGRPPFSAGSSASREGSQSRRLPRQLSTAFERQRKIH